ncbi:unnamed protein product [Closterium sp. Naga37s-1]|nr:unnamed protein product [Closterium sp. Naga37s-1]
MVTCTIGCALALRHASPFQAPLRMPCANPNESDDSSPSVSCLLRTNPPPPFLLTSIRVGIWAGGGGGIAEARMESITHIPDRMWEGKRGWAQRGMGSGGGADSRAVLAPVAAQSAQAAKGAAAAISAHPCVPHPPFTQPCSRIAILPLPSPHCHPPIAIPLLPSPHCRSPIAIPPLPSPHCRSPIAIPPLPFPHCHPPIAIPPLPSPHCHPPIAIPPLPSPHCHPPIAIRS